MDNQNKKFVKKLREKEEEATRFFFEYFYQHVFKVAYYITQDAQLAEDAVQETFLKAINKLHQLNDEAKINAWLTQIAINTARSLMRKNRRFPVVKEPDIIYQQVAKYLVEDLIVEKEDLLAIWRLIEDLSVDAQRTFILYYRYGVSIKEISYATDTPEGTVKSRLSRGRLFLRNKLSKSKTFEATGKKIKLYSSAKEVKRT